MQVVRASAGAGGSFLFGGLPREAERVWMAVQDGRVVGGNGFPVPPSAGEDFGLYLLTVENMGPGEVVAVNSAGLLVGHAHVSTSGEAGRPVGVLDAYGNVIGYVPVGDWAVPPPGRPARLADIHVYLLAPMTGVLPKVKEWWADRPGRDATVEAARSWWSAYPVGGLLPTHSSIISHSRALPSP
ncbi:MAG: hypothetical protein ACRDHV_00845 [Actinomycetota bacterium]